MHQALLILAIVASINHAQAQYYYGGYPIQPNYFRAGVPQPSFEERAILSSPASSADPRFFFSSVTVTIATTTSTVTLTSSTTCTTSTGTIKACSPSGRRRRGMTLTGDKKGRGLFYNEADEAGLIDGIFFPVPKKVDEMIEQKERPERQVEREPVSVPFVVQPGFRAPSEIGAGRFLVAFGTYTSFITTTSTYYATLTAACKSSTGYVACGGTGK